MKSRILSFAALFMACTIPAIAQDMSYKLPPKEIADLILAKPTPGVSISNNGQWILLVEYEALVPVEELAQPELGLAGMRINPRTFGPSRERYSTSIRLKDLSTLTEYDITGMPANAKISKISWSPEGRYIAFLNTTDKGIELWRVTIAEKKAAKISNRQINDVMGGAFLFVTDEQMILMTVPENIGKMPQQPLAPTGVTAQDSKGVAAPVMTFQDLLKNPYDEELFAYFATSQPILWSSGEEKFLGKADLYMDITPSPNDAYLLVETVQRPFSYIVPLYRFAQKVEVWDMTGKAVKQIANNPLDETRPTGYDVTSASPRYFSWRSDVPATLYWVEALDGGNGNVKVPFRDAVYTLAAPFTGEKQLFTKTELRFGGIAWGNDKLAMFSDGSGATRKLRTYRIDPSDLNKAPELLFERSANDGYSDPGSPYLMYNSFNQYVLYTGKGNNELLFTGKGASPEGDMPFLNRFDLKTKKTTTLWRCKAPYYESVSRVIDPEKRIFITSKQSVEEPANYYLNDLSKKKVTKLTSFDNPYPQMAGVQKQQVTYKRKDGVELSAVIYTPKGYDPQRDGKLPVLMWAYPLEYKSKADAGQVRGSKYTFTRMSYGSPVLWLTQGFAIMDNAEMPIVGEGDKEPNDTFLEQLTMNAEAAINKIEEMGIGDRNRVAVGGHSYGAFMTANLLAHTNLFKAGIARSGAYNRTLTPFGFQGETRTYWQAEDVYNTMSPFMFADKLKTPILLIHGLADNNTGTFTMQSERFFAALKGNGGIARLVLLPYESHGYSAKENILHMLYETDTWLKKYVKGE